MTPSHHGGSAARPSDADLEAMLARAAEEGARRALSDVGLGGKDAVLTIHDMRSLLECVQFVRRTAVQTAVHVITTGGADRAPDRDRDEAALVRAELKGQAAALRRRRLFGASAAAGSASAEADLLRQRLPLAPSSSAPPSGSRASGPTSPGTPPGSCRGRSSDAASASSASSVLEADDVVVGHRAPDRHRRRQLHRNGRLVRRQPAQGVETDWNSAGTSAPSTALLPTCAETISAVRARSSPRSMLFSSAIASSR